MCKLSLAFKGSVIAVFTLLLLGFITTPTVVSAQTGCDAALLGADMLSLQDAPTQVTSAAIVPAAGTLPEYCRVTGKILPGTDYDITFELRLPTNWNKKFYYYGCGGFCGNTNAINTANVALARGYATTASDMGTHALSAINGAWAYNNREREFNFGFRGTHATTLAAKTLIQKYYGKSPVRSYFQGCSTGGRQGMVEAQRYPDDFNGIISGAYVIPYTPIGAVHLCWSGTANLDENGNPIMSVTKLPMLHEAVLDACDGIDGLVDGIIEDPRKCHFDPAVLQCSGTPGPDCLTADEVKVVRRLYERPHDSKGRPLIPGAPEPGSELLWNLYMSDSGPSVAYLFGTDFVRYVAFENDPGPDFTCRDFDWDIDPPRLAFTEAIYGASNPDLRAFRNRGGKLIAFQGWSDDQVNPRNTIDYYETAVKSMGGLIETQKFFRLFMIPGMKHCSGGDGATQIDYLTALEQWVEHGIAPCRLVASHLSPNRRSRVHPFRLPVPDRIAVVTQKEE